MTALEIYQQSIDKQRILIFGEGSTLITNLVTHVLSFHHRKFLSVRKENLVQGHSDAPIIIFEGNNQLTDYKQHILVLGYDASTDIMAEVEALANQSPKSGIIIYPKSNTSLANIATRERTDVQPIPYDIYKHELVEGKTLLISSTKEKFPVELQGNQELQCISAVKELLKKIGISSGQFYKAVSSFKK